MLYSYMYVICVLQEENEYSLFDIELLVGRPEAVSPATQDVVTWNSKKAKRDLKFAFQMSTCIPRLTSSQCILGDRESNSGMMRKMRMTIMMTSWLLLQTVELQGGFIVVVVVIR